MRAARTPEEVREGFIVTEVPSEDPNAARFLVQSAATAHDGYRDVFTITRTASELDGVSFGCYQTALRAPTLDGLLDRFAVWLAGQQ